MSRVKIYCESCGWYGVSSLTEEKNFGGTCPQCGGRILMDAPPENDPNQKGAHHPSDPAMNISD